MDDTNQSQGSTRQRALEAIANAQPGVNQKALAGRQAAIEMGLQRAAAGQSASQQGTTTGGSTQQVQAGGAGATAALGKAGNEEQANTQQAVQSVANQSLQQQATSNQQAQAVAGRTEQAANTSANLAASALQRDLKEKLVDRQLRFKTDEQGRKVLNDRQLADYAIVTAKNQEDLANKKLVYDEAFQRQQQMLDTVIKKLDLQYQFETAKAKESGNFATAKYIAQLKADTELSLKKKAADVKNKQQIWQTGGGIIGGVVGAYFGPAGAMAGYAIGSGVGGAIGSNETVQSATQNVGG